MSERFDLHIKTNADYNGFAERFPTKKQALEYFVSKILPRIKIDEEIKVIERENSPFPKYRKSVSKYLKKLFSGKFPSRNIIDYSDYTGDRRWYGIEDIVGDDVYSRSDSHSYIISRGFYDNEEFEKASEYEEELGFVFAVNEYGMRLAIEELGTTVFFYEYNNSIEFRYVGNFYFDARIEKSDTNNLLIIGEKFFSIMLLSLFEQEICAPVVSDEEDDSSKLQFPLFHPTIKPDCLKFLLEREIVSKINENFIMVRKLSFSPSAILNQIKSLKKVGYNIEKNRNEYYMPPLICKKDGVIIIKCIESSDLPEVKKTTLVEKFKFDSGFARKTFGFFACACEGELPAPKRSEWHPP